MLFRTDLRLQELNGMFLVAYIDILLTKLMVNFFLKHVMGLQTVIEGV
jgi:hypothetical protein